MAHNRALTTSRKFFSLPIIIMQTTLAYREPALYSIRKIFSLNDMTNIFLVEYVRTGSMCDPHFSNTIQCVVIFILQ